MLQIGQSSDAFDHSGIEADRNLTLPLDRLEELVEANIVGDAAPRHFSIMGSLIWSTCKTGTKQGILRPIYLTKSYILSALTRGNRFQKNRGITGHFSMLSPENWGAPQNGIPRVNGVASKASGRMAAMRSPCARTNRGSRRGTSFCHSNSSH